MKRYEVDMDQFGSGTIDADGAEGDDKQAEGFSQNGLCVIRESWGRFF